MSNVAMMVPQGAETVFPKEEYARRVARLREQMATKGFDLFLTSGSAQLFVEDSPSNPAIIGPRNARSDAQNNLILPPRRFDNWSITVGFRSPCLSPMI